MNLQPIVLALDDAGRWHNTYAAKVAARVRELAMNPNRLTVVWQFVQRPLSSPIPASRWRA